MVRQKGLQLLQKWSDQTTMIQYFEEFPSATKNPYISLSNMQITNIFNGT
jgi:hypothetical protein